MWCDFVQRAPPIESCPVGIRGVEQCQGGARVLQLRQVESCLKDMGMTGLASAWAMARRRTKEYRRKLDAATPCSYAPIPDMTWPECLPARVSECWL